MKTGKELKQSVTTFPYLYILGLSTMYQDEEQLERERQEAIERARREEEERRLAMLKEKERIEREEQERREREEQERIEQEKRERLAARGGSRGITRRGVATRGTTRGSITTSGTSRSGAPIPHNISFDFQTKIFSVAASDSSSRTRASSSGLPTRRPTGSTSTARATPPGTTRGTRRA